MWIIAIHSISWILSLFCGCPCFGCRRCKRTREKIYREHYYATRCQINNGNGTEVIEMTSREHNRYERYKSYYYARKLQLNNGNEHDTNNGTNQQYETVNEDEIEEMIHLPLQTETEDKKQNHQNDSHRNEVNRT